MNERLKLLLKGESSEVEKKFVELNDKRLRSIRNKKQYSSEKEDHPAPKKPRTVSKKPMSGIKADQSKSNPVLDDLFKDMPKAPRLTMQNAVLKGLHAKYVY